MSAPVQDGPAPQELRPRTQLVPSSTASFTRTLRAEWTKFWSVRSTLWTFVALIVVTIGFSALFCLAVAANWDQIKPEDRVQIEPVSQSLSGIFLGQCAIIVLGALVITAEYSSRAIRTTLTATPGRVQLLAAKSLVLALVAFLAGVLTMVPSFLVGQLVLSTAHAGIEKSFGDPGVNRAVLGGALYVLACGLLGFALGAVLRHTAGAITAGVAIVFILPIMSNFLPGGWGTPIKKVLNAGGTILNARPLPDQFAPWTGYAVFSLWWVVLLLVAAVLIRRRDA